MVSKFFMNMTLVFVVFVGELCASDNPWVFSADAVAVAHRYQRQFGARLGHPLDPKDCLYGQKEFAAAYRGKRFLAPCGFVSETTRQLKELLESDVAKYLFALDVGSARLAVPADVYAKKYRRLPREEILPALLREPMLVAIYHAGLHLDSASSAKEDGFDLWPQKRTVIGYYDGRQNRVLPKFLGRQAYCESQGLVEVAGFDMMEHFLGELAFIAHDTAVTLDISFDDDFAEVPPSNMVRVKVR